MKRRRREREEEDKIYHRLIGFAVRNKVPNKSK